MHDCLIITSTIGLANGNDATRMEKFCFHINITFNSLYTTDRMLVYCTHSRIDQSHHLVTTNDYKYSSIVRLINVLRESVLPTKSYEHTSSI